MNSSYEIWTDKYTPKKLDEIVGQDKNVKKLKILSKLKRIPHMIISGDSGVGKTLAVKCLIREVGIDNILDLNITEDIRKINIIKNKIYNFIEQKLDRKIILIDDCDILNIQTQFLIKSIIEKSKPNLTVIMICNQLENMIETFQSRSIILKFNKISDKDIYIYLRKIITKEKRKMSKEVLNTIVGCSSGDLRKAINCLQTICITYPNCNKITKDNVFDVLDIPQPKVIKDIIEDTSYRNMIKKLDKILEMGYSVNDIISSFLNVVTDMEMDIDKKIKYIEKITFTDIKINEGIDSRIQLYNLLQTFL